VPSAEQVNDNNGLKILGVWFKAKASLLEYTIPQLYAETYYRCIKVCFKQ
jgi:hypothetical protein